MTHSWVRVSIIFMLVNSLSFTDVPPIVQHQPVDTLAHGLDRVLFKYVQLPMLPDAFKPSFQPRRSLATRPPI
jgi:hypothetical protein